MIAEADANGTFGAEYVWGHDGDLLRMTRGGAHYFYLHDALGSVRAVTDSNGTIVNRYDYFAYGATVDAIEGVFNPFQFAGEERDPSGLYYLRARYYDPEMGRFVSEDPVLDGENWYLYVAGNPVNGVDPWGLSDDVPECQVRKLMSTGLTREQAVALLQGPPGAPTDYDSPEFQQAKREVEQEAARLGKGAVNTILIPTVDAATGGSEHALVGVWKGGRWMWARVAASRVGQILRGGGRRLKGFFGTIGRGGKQLVVGAYDAVKRWLGLGREAAPPPAPPTPPPPVIPTSCRLAPGGGLAAHEARGGHLLGKHLGKTDADLLARLTAEPKISAASTFETREVAERVVAETIDANQTAITNWLASGNKNNLQLPYHGTDAIGRGILRGKTVSQAMTNAKVILKKDGAGGYFILTGYPAP
jgi:RHS repeat-associated protein